MIQNSTILARSDNRKRFLVAGALLPLAMSAAACSTGGQRLTRSGFLPNYDQLQRTKEHRSDAIYVAPDYAAGRYGKVIVEPVAWYAKPRDEKVVEGLKAQFQERLVKRLSTRYEVVPADQAGPGVMRVRAAITSTRPARWYINVPAQAAQLALGGFGLFRPSAGGAAEEIEVTDSVTGAPLIQLATFNNGQSWDVEGSYAPYGHARVAFSSAAKLLTEVAQRPQLTPLPPKRGRGASAPTQTAAR